MKRWIGVLLAVGAAPEVRADEGPPRPPPVIFFREPDAATARFIQDQLSGQWLGSATRQVRTESRERLAKIGEWTIPYLVEAIHGPKREKANRIRMNCVLALPDVVEGGREDPRILEALLAALRDENVWVRRAALVVLARYRRAQDHAPVRAMLRDPDENRRHQEAAALALGKLPAPGVEADLLEAATRPGAPSRRVTEAALLSAVFATPRAREVCLRQLGEHSPSVRLVAATGLVLRPVPVEDLPALQKRFQGEQDRRVRARLVHAMAAAAWDRAARRAWLFEVARATQEPTEVRVAALLSLSDEPGEPAELKQLRLRDQNDPVYAAMLAAIGAVEAPEAIDPLLQVAGRPGSAYLPIYAVGTLGWVLARSPQAHPREREIFESLANVRTQDAVLRELLDEVRSWNLLKPRPRLAQARRFFARFADPAGLRPWGATPFERALRHANALVLLILGLDDVPDVGSTAKAPSANLPDNKSPSANPDEADLFDYLAAHPLFTAEDLRAG